MLARAFLMGAPREAAEETLARAGLRRCVFAVAWQMTWHVHGLGDLCGGTRVAPPPDSEDESEESEAEATEVLGSEEKTPSALLCRKKRASEHASAARADAFRLRVASRLVDFFITAHPAMPLYVGVEAMRRDRAYLLSLGTDDFAELHVALSKLRVAPDWRPSRGEALDDDDDDETRDARRRRSRLWRHSSRRRAICSERIPRSDVPSRARRAPVFVRARVVSVPVAEGVSTTHPSREMLYRTRRCLRRWFRV